MTGPPAIDADDLVKEYGDLRALDGLSLTVERGEFFGLLGPNGAGKTTFIGTLVGLTRLDAGTATVFGHDVGDDRQAVRERVSIAPQEFSVDRFFPIREVLEHTATVHGIPRRRATERVADALETVGLVEKRDETFRALSGGMKRRFLLAQAMVSDPDLLILDEPTAGVDVEIRREVWEVVRRLNSDGTTVLLTTHYIEEAERLCDRVCILDRGRRVEIDTPSQLRQRGIDTIHLVTDAGEAAAEAVATIPAVRGVETVPDGLEVYATDADGTVPEVLRRLVERDCPVRRVEVDHASLEDVFVDLTRTTGDETGADGDGAAGREADRADGSPRRANP
jgi:ABC-2 type transport system ATP-binding protein